MEVFFDTEFTDFAHPRVISVGFAAADGSTLYVQVDGWTHAECSPFVRDVVLPLLDGPERLPYREAALRIDGWLRAFGESVSLYSDSAIDLRLLDELFATGNVARPALIEAAVFAPSIAGELIREALYEQTLRRHHALDDALALREAWQAMPRLEVAGESIQSAADGASQLWLDDVRPAPAGWTRVGTAAEAIVMLQLHRVDALSLDHDLGNDPAAGTGYDVLAWLERMVATVGFVPPVRISVHSSNPPAAQQMDAAIDAIERLKQRSTKA